MLWPGRPASPKRSSSPAWRVSRRTESSAALGYRSTLCAAKVPEGDLDRVAAAINAFPQVTHNYLRDNDQYNVWFTVIAEGEQGVSRTVREIERAAGVEVRDFSSLAFYKIKVNFDMEEGGRNEGPTG